MIFFSNFGKRNMKKKNTKNYPQPQQHEHDPNVVTPYIVEVLIVQSTEQLGQ